MTLTQGLQPSAILSRAVAEPWRRPSQGAARGRVERQFRAHFGRDDRAQKLDRTQCQARWASRRLRLGPSRLPIADKPEPGEAQHQHRPG
jgi:hypothetical protein